MTTPPRRCASGHCFFFQAEDGIRDLTVTGVQTCALPICCQECVTCSCCPSLQLSPTLSSEDGPRKPASRSCTGYHHRGQSIASHFSCTNSEIGRASCRERV